MSITIVFALILSLCAFFAFYLILKGRQKAPSGKRHENLVQLEEVLRTAQLTNSGFFQSLELVQKNLESLLARAESAEQRMRNLMLQPGGEKRDQYTAAALLLSEGQEPHRVAAMLSLPLAQVEIVQQLNRLASKEKKPMQRKKRAEEESTGRKFTMPSRIAGREEKISQPVLLVDLLKKSAHGNALRAAAPRTLAGTKPSIFREA
jgi:hypothetical protein